MECYNLFSEVYDNLIKDGVNYISYGNFIKDNIKNIEKRSYLDLACGTGNLTIEISPLFNETYGVDLSYDMLSKAASKEGLQGVNFINQDITKLNIGKKFNLITCSLDSINYILDKRDVKSLFKRVYSHLEEGGLFIFDINTIYKLEEIMGNNTFTFDSKEVSYIWENYFCKEMLFMDITFFILDGDNYKKFKEEHVERGYSREFIEKSLKEVNFIPVSINDGWTSKKVKKNTQRLVYVIKKG